MSTLTSCVTYRTRDIARAVQRSSRTVQRYLNEKYPGHEGWHSFTLEEFQSLVEEIKEAMPLAHQRRCYWLNRKLAKPSR